MGVQNIACKIITLLKVKGRREKYSGSHYFALHRHMHFISSTIWLAVYGKSHESESIKINVIWSLWIWYKLDFNIIYLWIIKMNQTSLTTNLCSQIANVKHWFDTWNVRFCKATFISHVLRLSCVSAGVFGVLTAGVLVSTGEHISCNMYFLLPSPKKRGGSILLSTEGCIWPDCTWFRHH